MTKKVVTNDGKKGGWLVGKRHYDKGGKPLGGIKAVVTDAGGKPVELEGGEVIINREASKKHWKELSRINQSAGNGVPIEPPSGSFDEDPSEDYENGGKIEFNANHIPNKWILNYAIKIKEEHPDVWALGGNIFGNQAFINLKRVAERGHWLDSEEWMYKKWRSFVARHKGDFRIQGVIAMLKWVDKVDKGWQYMKNLIEEEIKKREAKKSPKMSKGAMINSKSKYSVEFKKRKSLGNYDRELEISETNKTLKQIYNLLYNIEYRDNGWYIKGSILIKDDNGVQVRIQEFTSDLDLQKMFDEKNSSKMSNGGKLPDFNNFKTVIKISDIKDPNEITSGGIKNKYKGSYKRIFDILNEDLIFSEVQSEDDHLIGNDLYVLFNETFDAPIYDKISKLKNVEIVKQMSNGGSTPAPLKDRIKGSKFNEKGTASTSSKAESIKFDDNTIASIQSLIDAHNEKYPSKKITLAVAKAVVRRGMGAYSSSHRTTIAGGKPNSRTAWGLARLKAFIYKAQTGKSKSGKYSQDNDLFEELNISVQKMNDGGSVDETKLIAKSYVLNRHPKKGDVIHGGKTDGYEIKKITKTVKRYGTVYELYLLKDSTKRIVTYIPKTKTITQFKTRPFFTKKGEYYATWDDGLDDKMNYGGDVRGMSWYSDFKKEQLLKGTEHELEHSDTIEKFKKKGISDRQVAAQIAKDHLEEDENYYIELDKMERKKFATGGLVTTYGGEANIGDKGKLNTRKGRIDIQITNITDKWVIFNDLTEGGKRKDTPRDKFIENYRANAPLGSSVQSQQVASTTQPTQTTAKGTTTQWTANDFKNTKIIVDTTEKSEKFQELLFSLGGEWADLDVPKESLRKKVHFTDEKYLLVGPDLVFFFFSKEDTWDDSSKREIFYDDIFPSTSTQQTTSTTKSTKRAVSTPLNDYRIKTQQEFIKQYGNQFKKAIAWNEDTQMDWLFGKRIDEIIVPGEEKKVFTKILAKDSFNTDKTLDRYGRDWVINEDMWVYDPVSAQETESKAEYVLKKPLKREDLYDTKIIVDTPEKSEAFQKAAFDLGIEWTAFGKIPANIESKYLFVRPDNDDKQTLGYSKDFTYFDKKAARQIYFDDLFELRGSKKSEIDVEPVVENKDVKSEKELLVEQYNDVLFLISVTPTTDTENMLSLKARARELKDSIDLIDLELRKKAQTELTLLDELFDASTIKPQERYKFMPYTDGFAPDGQPTALPKNVYNWTMSEEFQNWFGNFTLAYNYRNSSYENVPCSVVVNKNYEPLIVYHGTGSEFSFFKFDSFPAMYFAENEAYSNWFAEMKGQQNGTQGYVYPFVLNIRTPLDLTLFETNKISAAEFIDWMYLQTGLDENELKVNKALLDPSLKNQAWVYLRNSPEMLKVLRDKNVCDGIIYYEDNPSVDVSSPAYITKAYIVFNANSAKIANNERHIQTIPAMRSFFLKRGGKL
jgi:hypothetical protein